MRGLMMPYRYLDDIATADVAFEAWGKHMEDMFIAAADASMNVMVEELSGIEKIEHRRISLWSEAVDMLLFEFIQELIFFKDAEQLLLRVSQIFIERENRGLRLKADLYGEVLDPLKHELNADVKAVTLHRFAVEQTPGKVWKATVILDI
jgi:SHS2 domain-containing protein